MAIPLALALGVLLVSPGRARHHLWQTTVTGRIELLNAKVKSSQGRIDASGVVVWLDALGAAPVPGSHPRRELIQQGKRFAPHILAVDLGTEVEFPNYDPFFHNVFSVYHGKRFDLGLYASGETRPVRFNRPGVSYIFCNIHPQMSAVVVTLNTPYYGISDQQGNFSISGVPEGRYQLNLWHERATPEQLTIQSRAVRIGPANSDLGILRINEEGYIPRPHQNKYGEDYNPERNKPLYKKY